MSPEQAKGKPVDKRADIWAFGCVLYEMLTGQRAFAGEDVTDFVVAVRTKEPDWLAVPAATPPRIVELLERCLKKDARERLRDIGDARIEIEEALRPPPDRAIRSAPNRTGDARLRAATAAKFAVAAAAGAAVALMFLSWRGARTVPSYDVRAPLIRASIDLPSDAPLALGTHIPIEGFDSPAVTVSPDGRRLAYVGQSGSTTMLYLHDMAGLTPVPLTGTGGAIYAFFSPDGRWVGFLTNDKVMKIGVEGGSPITLCGASSPNTATWAADGAIYFGENEGSFVSRVPADGGRPAVVVPERQGVRNAFSQALPDGHAVLMTTSAGSISTDYADIILVSVANGRSKLLVRSGYDARYVSPGYLVFGRGGNLLAMRFDVAKEEVSGDPVAIVSGASMESLFGQVHASASNNGLIAYAPGRDRAVGRLAWVDRQGKTELIPAPPAVYGAVDLTSTGDRLAVHVADVTDYVWVYDFRRGEGRKLAFGDNSGWPVWSPDNQAIAFAAWRSPVDWRVVTRVVDGEGSSQEVVRWGQKTFNPSSWSADGRALALDSFDKIGVFTFGGRLEEIDGKGLWGAFFSPDGRWVAFTKSGSGRPEIFVRSYPDGKSTRQISVNGGMEPLWCPCGELFYRVGNRWMSSVIRTQPDLQWDPPRLAFETDFIDTPGRSYDVSPDGKRLLIVKRAEPDVRNRINLVANWTAGQALR